MEDESPDRYEIRDLIGEGGMGRVYRVWDNVLSRPLAMKVMHPQLARIPTLSARFRAEATMVAQLQHPAIVPVYDQGTRPDGRIYFTMPEVTGETMESLIQQAHASRHDPADQFLVRRLIAALRIAASGVAYAHSKGVIHRDLKPANIILGQFGEVMVLDWGMATLRDYFQNDTPAEETDRPPVEFTPRLGQTAFGEVQGSVWYMSPEQARGKWDLVGPASDVFSLGAILFQILSGRLPRDRSATKGLAQAQAGEVFSLPDRESLPQDLVMLCEQAMQPDPAMRPSGATKFADQLARWAHGAENLGRARERIRQADALLKSLEDHHRLIIQVRGQAEKILAPLSPLASEEEKSQGWALQDAATSMEAQLPVMESQYRDLLQQALILTPDLQEAHERLFLHLMERHRKAEEAGNAGDAQRLLMRMGKHKKGAHNAYVSGRGELVLESTRPARITLYQCIQRHRRLVEAPTGIRVASGVPLSLPIGTYVALLEDLETGVTVRVPVFIERAQRWNGQLDGSLAPRPIRLPNPWEIPEGSCLVPAGPFYSGGDPNAFGTSLPAARVSLPDFAIQRFPVTNERWITFLDDLVANGREDEALDYAPRSRSSEPGARGALIYGQSPGGGFSLVADGDGDLWQPQWPVVMITVTAMRAYAEWLSVRTHRTWRLPFELEWEKAARGVDRRLYVWGTEAFDPTWCHMTESHGATRRTPARVGSYPVDRSPYGVADLAGNVMDVCADPYAHPADGFHPATASPVLTARGGNWAASRGKSRVCHRGPVSEDVRAAITGFRLVTSIGADTAN